MQFSYMGGPMGYGTQIIIQRNDAHPWIVTVYQGIAIGIAYLKPLSHESNLARVPC